MSIDRGTATNIITMLNAAITSYNKVVCFKDLPQNLKLVDEFNSALQYYSTIEVAFREVITNLLKLQCPQNLHEMVDILISNLNPSPLEKGIDLFYILRYKDNRNQATHNLKLQNQNPYPRLFLNAERFIKTYIDYDAKFESWTFCNDKFDFADFMQKFSTSKYDDIRVLVIGPMHDYDKSKLETLTKIHWNIVLDFDPYSNETGFRSSISQSNTHIIQLSQVEQLNIRDLSLDNITWVNCDGDHSLGVECFQTQNARNSISYIPAMLEGQKNWKNCYNPYYSRKNANQLIREFFGKYYSVLGYNTDIVFLMDYSNPVASSIVQAIEDNLDSFSYYTNVFFIDEINSSRLEIDKENYNNWIVYHSSVYSFIEGIEKNINTSTTSKNLRIEVPVGESTCDGVVSERSYHNISKHFYLLHKSFPLEMDEPDCSEEKYGQKLYDFSRGEEANWQIIRKNEIANFNIYSSALDKVLDSLSKGSNTFDLLHVAGFGGTTIGKQIAYHISKIYPVLYMKSYDSESIVEQLKHVYSLSRKRVIIFIEERLFSNIINDRNECMRMAEATTIPYTLIFIGRRAQTLQLREKNQIFIKHYIKEDIDELLDFNKKVYVSDIDAKRQLYNAKSEDFINNLGEKNCCPFTINLSIYMDKYIKIDDYVEEFVPSILCKSVLLKVFVYTCIFSKFINEGIPYQFVTDILNTGQSDVLRELMEKYDALLYIKNDEEFKIREIAIRAPLIASALLYKLLGSNGNEVGYRNELNNYLKELIKDFKTYFQNRSYANKRLRQLFIDKMVEENEYNDNFVSERNNIESVKRYFSQAIVELWNQDNLDEAGSIFMTLSHEYPDDPYFLAHTARYYAYTNRDFDIAREYADRAIALFSSGKDANFNVAPDIYHVKGMCLMKKLFADLDDLSSDVDIVDKKDIENILLLSDEAIQAFDDTRSFAYGNNIKSLEYACSAWLKLLLQVLKKFEQYKKLEHQKIQEYLETAESLVEDLEDIFVLNGKDDLLPDLQRKRQVLYSYRSDIGKALSDWNNFYDRSKSSRIYENCLYACKHRYYLLEYRMNYFKDINTQNDMKKINNLAEDYKYSLSNTSVDKLKLGDLSTYISLVRFSNEKIAVVSSLINSLYLKDQDRPDIKILFYRYVLKFLSAYHGDRISLQDTIVCIQECKERANRISGKTNTLEYLKDGNEMDCLISKKYLLKVSPEVKNKIYDSSELHILSGLLKCEGNKTSIIPYDKNGKLMNGIEVFVNLKFNSHVSRSDNGQVVNFKVGFSYDGLRAENMSVRVVSNNNNAIENFDDNTETAIGGIVDFFVTRALKGKKDNIIALIGKVGTNEDCILHISNVASRRISNSEMEALYEYSKRNKLTVYIQSKKDRGWEASLYKAGVVIDEMIAGSLQIN